MAFLMVTSTNSVDAKPILDILADMKAMADKLPKMMPLMIHVMVGYTRQRRLFPASKNRSQRIRKKLIARFRGEEVTEPACTVIGNRIICHPVWEIRFFEEMKKLGKLHEYLRGTLMVEVSREFWEMSRKSSLRLPLTYVSRRDREKRA